MTKNNQIAFDLIVNHLRKQGKRSMRRDSEGRLGCAYRGDDGSKCAIGVLIPDSDYLPSFEGHEAHYTPIYDILEKYGYFFGMCFDMQVVHDSVAPKDWEKAFEIIARMYNLIYTPVQKEE